MPRVHQIERERMVMGASTTESRALDLIVAVISYVLGLVELFLTFRFLFQLFGANAGNGFVNFIYSLTDPLVAPFRGIFSTAVTGSPGFSWATIVAMIVYAIVAYVLIGLVSIDRDESSETL